MTEHEWLTSAKPLKMLDWLTGMTGERESVSDRKLRLFACACCRQSWHLLNERSRHAVEVAERYADGKASSSDVAALTGSIPMHYPVDLQTYARVLHPGDAITNASAAVIVIEMHDTGKLPTLANLLRSIVGNPFRPLLRTSTHIYQTHGVNVVWRFRVPHSVVALATVAYEQRLETACQRCYGDGEIDRAEEIGAYEERGPIVFGNHFAKCPDCHGTGKLSTGQLDPHNLSILADALEDAGCDNAELLSGLRSPEPRYRGWHVLDAILGKE